MKKFTVVIGCVAFAFSSLLTSCEAVKKEEMPL
jgi:hypothetical protein